MKKLVVVAFALITALPLAACGGNPDHSEATSSEVLKILNWEDYIYEAESDEDEPSTIDQFIEYMYETEGVSVEVVYDTFDTNETMLNSLQTGKTSYDLLVPSDYMIQKLMSSNMLEPFDPDATPNYDAYASPYLKGVFDQISAPIDGIDTPLSAYTRGYMWGTLGIIFNPEFSMYEGLEMEAIVDDFSHWPALWDQKYQGSFSIKDSMRDTYSVGVMKAYDTALQDLLNAFHTGEIDATEYNNELSIIFNKNDVETIGKVKDELLALKDNAFGFEVDSGKEDIKTGKIGANIAWSGDAVYSMDLAEEESGVELYYSLPETGANIWFDGFVMPKGANKDLAQKFVDFVSDPYIASLNMNYIGYTPFIAGDAIIDTVRDWYDPRTEYVYDEDGNETGASYDDDYTDIALDEEWEMVDLTYFFNGTYTDYTSDDAIFYAYEYLPFEDNSCVGRQFFCQYPDADTILRGAVMQDFGANNGRILQMWEEVRSTYLPVWAIVILVLEIVLIVGLIIYFTTRKQIKKRLRRDRQKATQ